VSNGASVGWVASTPFRVLAGIGCGALSWFVPASLADEVLVQSRAEDLAAAAAAGESRPKGRRDRLLPGRLGVYFVLGLCLYSHLPYGRVLAELSAGAGRALAAARWRAPAPTALTGLRRRLGERPFELLFARVAGTLPAGREPWSHVCGLLAVAWDGTAVKVPASPENIAFFGRPGHRRKKEDPAGTGHYPQARVVALVACGTRALIGAAAGPLRAGEQALAAGLAGCLRPGMLLLADRGFYGWQLWRQAAGTGADLLWRVRSGLHLPVVRELPDGSWLTVLNDPAAVRRRTRRNGERRRRGSRLPPDTGPLPGAVTARVIQFTLTVTGDDGTVRTERYRMLTTLLDWRAAPARDLAESYARRWAVETAFRELKTYLRGPGRILRSRDPALARQEIWAYLITYQAIRAVIARTAAGTGRDPGRLSFTAALHAIRAGTAGSPARALAEAEAAILAVPVPDRRGRVCPRAVTEPSSPFPSRRNQPGPRHAAYTLTITTGQATPTTADQPKQQQNQETAPP
jgi:Insertion element 4 transposase N-terminal/Transposase DDE domain